MLNPFLHWSGIVAWVLVGLLALRILFEEVIHPFLEAVSIVRFLFRWHLARKAIPTTRLCMAVPGSLLRHFIEFRGRWGETTYTMDDGSQWKGLGNYELRPPVINPPCPLP